MSLSEFKLIPTNLIANPIPIKDLISNVLIYQYYVDNNRPMQLIIQIDLNWWDRHINFIPPIHPFPVINLTLSLFRILNNLFNKPHCEKGLKFRPCLIMEINELQNPNDLY